MSKLCLVPTPIGNLEDITLRAIRYLQEADFILAEDTRVTKKLLAHLNISKNVFPFHAHNEHNALNNVVQRIQTSELVVLVSDAGTPGISDPGFLLVRECVKNEINIECLPGPTAFVPALVASGFPCDKFVFEGFLPHKKGRQTRLQILAEESRTIVLYESPHRLVKLLGQIEEFMGKERQVCVVRELTKIYEEYQRGTAEEVKQHYEKHEPKGEIVVIIEGKSKE
ncbi:MAG: 16S rRNA (cytidine(1402)-2'-O)-methyltransferase [Crocinitomicaceae bacterium]|nr:16S rRNA (cytidine(1402)-2'-O)-methyltransferase [Taishania sp.]